MRIPKIPQYGGRTRPISRSATASASVVLTLPTESLAAILLCPDVPLRVRSIAGLTPEDFCFSPRKETRSGRRKDSTNVGWASTFLFRQITTASVWGGLKAPSLVGLI